MFFAIYRSSNGEILKTVSAPFYIKEMFELEEGYEVIQIDKEANDKTEYILEGQLIKKPHN